MLEKSERSIYESNVENNFFKVTQDKYLRTIAYQLTSGTINLDTAPEVAVASAGSETTNAIVSHFENFATVGGLIGEYIAGTIIL